MSELRSGSYEAEAVKILEQGIRRIVNPETWPEYRVRDEARHLLAYLASRGYTLDSGPAS